MVSAIDAAAPEHDERPAANSDADALPAFSSRFRPLVESAVKVSASAAALCPSVMPDVAASMSATTSVRSRKLPSESSTATDVSPIWTAPSSMLALRSRMIAVRAVPASLPLRPWFAIMASSVVTVPTSWPIPCRYAAQFLYASPSCSVVVLLLACEYASRSDRSAACDASMPNADR